MSIKVTSLCKTYGTQKAVDHVSFELTKGEIVGFLGPNGAGKSTTMKMITGYLPPTSGSASVCGFDVQEKPMEVRRRVGYLPEANPLYYEMYVREYLEFTARIHKMGKESRSRIEEMIEMTVLGKEAHKKIGALSKGYKQRVGIAQAMLHNPEVLILDEPTSGLDPNQIIEIRDLVKNIGREKTVLLSTHIMQEVQAMCSRVIIINNGKIVADDSISHLREANSNLNVLVVSFDKPIDETLLNEIKSMNGYEKLEDNKYSLKSRDTDELPRELMQWALKHNTNITSMQSEVHSLEDVFRTLTKQ